MARKSIKGYAEKNYYDNTRFNGGIVATNDPLNEGYFKHLVNFDISDMGQSLTPRKGYLTTTLASDETTVYVNAIFDISIDTNIVDISINQDVFKQICNAYKCIIPQVHATLQFDYGNGDIHNYNIYYDAQVFENEIVFNANNNSNSNIYNDIPEGFKMLRLYNNTAIAPIPDSASVQFSIDDIEVALIKPHINTLSSSNTIYFYDEALGEYIYFDYVRFKAWRVKFDVTNNFISNYTHIDYIDISDLYNIMQDPEIDFYVPYVTLPYGIKAHSYTDDSLIRSYIIKVYYKNNINTNMWLKLYYRKDEVTSDLVEGTKDGNTLVVSYLDTSDIVDYIDPSKRNIASSEDIIPKDFQEVYTADNKPDGFVPTFPMIYFKDNKDRYLILTTQSVEGMSIIPNFYIEEAPPNYVWCYTYNVTRMDHTSGMYTEDVVYTSPIFNVNTNLILDIDDEIFEIISSYNNHKNEVYKTLEVGRSVYYNVEKDVYHELCKDITKLGATEDTSRLEDTYIIYLVPKIDWTSSKTLSIPVSIKDGKINYDLSGLPRHFHYGKLAFSIIYNSVNAAIVYPEDSSYSELYDKADSYLKNISDAFTEQECIFNSQYCNEVTGLIREECLDMLSKATYTNMLDTLRKLHPYYNFYVRKASDLVDYEDGIDKGYDCIFSTALDSPIIAFCKDYDDEHLNTRTPEQIWKYVENVENAHIVFNCMRTATNVSVATYQSSDNTKSNYIEASDNEFSTLFPNSINSNNSYNSYILATNIDTDAEANNISTLIVRTKYNSNSDKWICADLNTDMFNMGYNNTTETHTHIFNRLFKPCTVSNKLEPTLYPMLNPYYQDTNLIQIDLNAIPQHSSLFSIKNGSLIATLNNDNPVYTSLLNMNYFNTGVNISFYLMRLPTKEYIDSNPNLFEGFEYNRETFIQGTSLKLSKFIVQSTEIPNTYTRKLKDDPKNISNAEEFLVFKSMLGDHIVTYIDNKLYISKEGIPYYFTEDYKKEYPEPIVKVIQYKDMLLVFTTQNLYAVYFYEDVVNVENGTDDEGNPKYVQQKVYKFASLPVLYNLMVNEKYKDAIQVYNQMVLFYSADGQMFLIKPTAAIDSNTRFSIQYFNKSANDILLNYKDYMQERLRTYNIEKEIKDVNIKVSATINYIKIYYSAPGIMTYILIYDVLNNRYYSYDTLSFNCIKNIEYTQNGDVFITEHDGNLYFTLSHASPNDVDNNVDISFYDNFHPYEIHSEIDTGTINLNNHLKKRFKDLHVIYKNLDANSVEFKLETFVDDTPIITYVDSNLDVKDVSSYNTLTVVDDINVTQLIENTALFNFTEYSSNKIITHKSNIISKGKSIRMKMYFNSKGKYKIQGYGLIYKEHTV